MQLAPGHDGFPGKFINIFSGLHKTRANSDADKTEVVIPFRAVDGGPHHQMIKMISMHRVYVYCSHEVICPGDDRTAQKEAGDSGIITGEKLPEKGYESPAV